MVKYPLYQKFCDGASRGRRALPNVSLGPPVILETTRDRKLNLKTQLAMDRYSFRIYIFSARGSMGAQGPLMRIRDSTIISETTRARKLKVKTQLG